MTKRGFSLLEILIALSVMLVGIIGVMSLFPVGLRASKMAENYTLAAILAQYSLDEARLTSFAGLTPGTTSGTFSAPDDKFSWQRVVDDTGLPPNLKKISVTISWSDFGSTRSEEFVTYIANY